MATKMQAMLKADYAACTALAPAAQVQKVSLSAASPFKPKPGLLEGWKISSGPSSGPSDPWGSRACQMQILSSGHCSKSGNRKDDVRQAFVCNAVLQNATDLAALATDEPLLVKQKAAELRDLLQGTSIFLVGMMGSGKTTVGRILADALGYCFFDSDAVVEQAAGGASVATIFAENGEEAFRDAETMAIAQLSTMLRVVVATGGGAVIRRSNWGRMRDGVTVWLNVPLDALALRLAEAGTESRPILATELTNGNHAPDLYTAAFNTLSSIFEERQALYTPADAEVSLEAMAAELGGVATSSISPSRIALQVLEEIEALIQTRRREDEARHPL